MNSYISQLLKYIWCDVMETMQYLPVALLVFLVILIANILFIKQWQIVSISRAVFISYIAVLCLITFFSRDPGARDGMDLLPLATIGNGPQGDAYVLENILLFIPFGIFLPLAFKNMRSFFRCTGMGLLSSVLIEMSQYITKRGYVQTDDVIMNTLGCVLGYMIYRMVRHLIRREKERGRYGKIK